MSDRPNLALDASPGNTRLLAESTNRVQGYLLGAGTAHVVSAQWGTLDYADLHNVVMAARAWVQSQGQQVAGDAAGVSS